MDELRNSLTRVLELGDDSIVVQSIHSAGGNSAAIPPMAVTLGMRDILASRKIRLNDRVKRTSGVGCFGVVKDIRSEVTASPSEKTEKNLLVCVLWDNGTQSYFTPDALEVVKQAE